MADETQDCGTREQISICIRYVTNNEVQEHFLGFVQTAKTDAASISAALISALKAWGLDMTVLQL